MSASDLQDKLNTLPTKPGVYLYRNKAGKVIYVGKAVNLKNRVRSYFHKSAQSNVKTRKLVQDIADLEFIIAGSELEALLLENNLIKKYQPRYNIMLKDDKTFPWICIRNEPFPRVYSTRTVIHDGSSYFGPYTSAYAVKVLLTLIRQLYKLRTCKHSLTAENN